MSKQRRISINYKKEPNKNSGDEIIIKMKTSWKRYKGS